MADRRADFVKDAQAKATRFVTFMTELQKLQDVYDAEQFHPDAGDPAGENQLLDEDCVNAGVDLTAAEITAFMGVVKELLTVDYDASSKNAVVSVAQVL